VDRLRLEWGASSRAKLLAQPPTAAVGGQVFADGDREEVVHRQRTFDHHQAIAGGGDASSSISLNSQDSAS
jgi:hypothetical protein